MSSKVEFIDPSDKLNCVGYIFRELHWPIPEGTYVYGRYVWPLERDCLEEHCVLVDSPEEADLFTAMGGLGARGVRPEDNPNTVAHTGLFNSDCHERVEHVPGKDVGEARADTLDSALRDFLPGGLLEANEILYWKLEEKEEAEEELSLASL